LKEEGLGKCLSFLKLKKKGPETMSACKEGLKQMLFL
jgi:hypothetical protein